MATTKAKPKASAVTKPEATSERYCPNCGQLHASSFVPEAELSAYADQGVKASTLPAAAVYRMFVCDGAFYAVPHKEEG